MAFPLLAVPLAHASGGYIAATIGTGGASYIAGTLSATAAGAMVAGNATILAIGAGASAAAGAAATVATTIGWKGLAALAIL